MSNTYLLQQAESLAWGDLSGRPGSGESATALATVALVAEMARLASAVERIAARLEAITPPLGESLVDAQSTEPALRVAMPAGILTVQA